MFDLQFPILYSCIFQDTLLNKLNDCPMGLGRHMTKKSL